MPAEITTYCFYPGDDKTFMVANAIFRMVNDCMLAQGLYMGLWSSGFGGANCHATGGTNRVGVGAPGVRHAFASRAHMCPARPARHSRP